MSLAVGDTVLKHGIILAPMAGVTDLPFRLLCREQGCEMAVTEMVSAKAILYGNKTPESSCERIRMRGLWRCSFLVRIRISWGRSGRGCRKGLMRLSM